MTKLSFDITGVIVDVPELKGNKLTDKVLTKLITEFEGKSIEEKIALIKSVRIASDGALSFANVKVGKMVETKDGNFGMIIKINKKTILVSSSRGMVSGPPEAFKETTKTVDDLKKSHKTFYKHVSDNSKMKEEGHFVDVKIKSGWKTGITLNNLSRNSITVYLYETNSTVKISEQEIDRGILVKVSA